MAVTGNPQALPISDEQQSLLKLDNQLCFQIYSASRAMTRRYRPLLNKLGLTYPQYLVMLVLWEQHAQAHNGKSSGSEQPNSAITVSLLGEHLRLDSGTLTPLLKRLEQQGLLLRQRSSADERQVNVSLTTAGVELSEDAAHVPMQLLCDIGTPIEDLLGLKQQLESLLNQLGSD